MQFIPEGPNIPEALLNAHADGDVVFFCGAGVSVDAGYPLFGGLVTRLRNELLISDTTELDLAIKESQFDYALYIIEQKLKKDGHVYRRKVAEILSEPPIKLDVHDTLLSLATDSHKKCRLVTTNFDRLFFDAAKKDDAIPFDKYPKLPIPKKTRWNGIVHLHGMLPKGDPSKEDLYNLVLNSADFGEAYITDSYCSKFVVELLRNFTVVFVGYSINDPVMRYLLDAISVAQTRDQSAFKKPYVFVPAKEKDLNKVEREWRLRPVEAIPYLIKQKNYHFRLYDTLSEWVKLASGGQRERKTLALNEAQKPFMKEDTFAKQRLLWALDDETGKTAQALANADDTAPIEWLPVFAQHGLLDQTYSTEEFVAEVMRQQGKDPKTEEGGEATPPEYQNSITRGKIGVELKPVTEKLLKWMQRHVNQLECADWIVRNGAVPHPSFSQHYRRGVRMDEIKPTDETRRFWEVITSDAYRLSQERNYHWLDIKNSRDFTNATHRLEFLSNVELRLSIKPLLMRHDDDEIRSFIAEFDYGLEYRNSRLDYEVRNILENTGDYHGLDLLVSDLTGVIERGLGWLTLVDKASDEFDISSYWIASISKHAQDEHPNDFALIVFLLREGFDKLLASDRQNALLIAKFWRSKRFPLFRRLLLYAGAVFGAELDDDCFDLLTVNNGKWLWSYYIKREVKRYLRLRVKDWPRPKIEDLCNQILAGPERDHYREMQDDEWDEFRARLICRYLLKLSQGGVALPENAAQRLCECDFTLPDDHSDEFIMYSEGVRTVQWGDDIDVGDDQRFTQANTADRIAMLEQGALKTTAHFRKLGQESPIDALATLEAALEANVTTPALWSDSFCGLSDFFSANRNSEKDAGAEEEAADNNAHQNLGAEAGRRFFEILRKIPADIIEQPSVASSLGYCWRSSPTKELNDEDYLVLWDRLWEIFAASEKMEGQELAINFAINNPAGQLMEQLFSRLWPIDAKVGMGLPESLTDRLEAALAANNHEAADASSIIIASRLGVLHLLDQNWTNTNVLPLFKWDTTPSALNYWSAYLWNGRFNPDLFAEFQQDFITALGKEDQLDENAYRILCQMFTLATLGSYGLSTSMIKETISNLSNLGLRRVTDFIRHQMLNSKDAAATRWRNAIQPWFNKYWPRDRGKGDPSVIENFAMTALYADEAFPEALAWFEKNGLLAESREASTIIYALEKKENGAHEDFENTHTLIERYPADVLRLLWLVRPFQWDHGQGGELLQRIVNQEGGLTNTPEYIDLAAILNL